MKAPIRIKLLPKQMQFLHSGKREVGYSGAFGAGKTYALCVKAVVRASVPGAVEGLVRKHNVTLKKSTLRTLLRGVGDLPPVLPAGSYSHHKSEQIIKIKGGGEIMYFGIDDPEKIGSVPLTGCAIDEAVELNEEDYRQLRGRIRVEAKNLSRQIYWACNPGPPSHFLADRFGLVPGATCAENCEAIQTRSHDNVYLPADYLADLDTFEGLAKKRYVDGLWVGSDGLVYDTWDRFTHVTERDKSEFKRFIVVVDEGYTNPCVMLLIGEDGDGRLHLLHERYQTKMQDTDKVAWANDYAANFKVDAFVIDPSAVRLIELIRDNGHHVVAADNAVFDGISRVQSQLAVAGDGLPRMTVDPGCENTIKEFETYEWKNGKDEPVKANDHAMDAIRYGVAYCANPSEVVVSIVGGGGYDRYDDERYWR